MEQNTILFLTCANNKYEMFVIPFLFSVFATQDDSYIEIFLESKKDFLAKHGKGVEIIKNNMSENFVLTEQDFSLSIPNSVRFLNQPETKADYVYISDIDIFYTDTNIIDIHLSAMKENHQDFSNIIRPGTPRLTGLHFTKWDAMYPIPKSKRGKRDRRNDELILNELVTEKTGKPPRKDLTFRPVHGIHTSPNRTIAGNGPRKPSWGINEQKAKRWPMLIQHPVWKSLIPHLDENYKVIVEQIDSHIQRHYKDNFYEK